MSSMRTISLLADISATLGARKSGANASLSSNAASAVRRRDTLQASPSLAVHNTRGETRMGSAFQAQAGWASSAGVGGNG
eukprot:68276-Rhodomonas_salina.1